MPAPRRADKPTDLMAALRASVEASQGGGVAEVGGNGRLGGDGDLADLSKDELYERAKELDIKGRADMSKDELVEAAAPRPSAPVDVTTLR